ncbi:MAG TPA: c-type cytochrome [Casimicrobiaceae bacterium]|nr:c-type cytochrome [Casimicrobiaceae bacterium]
MKAARFAGVALVTTLLVVGCAIIRSNDPQPTAAMSPEVIEGQRIFRFDTFGDEQFWTDKARLHEVIEKEVPPLAALKLGLKVDLDNLNLARFVLHNPFGVSGTKELLRQNAVVGVQATFDQNGNIDRVGITCALCHSTVDNALLPGIGRRRDGWANTDLDVGAIVALSPALSAEQKAVYRSWGKGKYDPRYNIDGKSSPLAMPPAYGLAQVRNATFTADGSISYWNAYVAVTQMHGQGNFSEPRLGIDVKHSPDLVTPKLAALRAYQHSLPVPPPPAGSFEAAAAERGRAIFDRACATCHVGATGTDNNEGNKLHAPADTGVDGAYAARSASKGYRTTPLRALWQHPPYFHDGSAATLPDVVTHYNRVRALGLTAEQQRQLVEYLKSI